MRGASSDPCSEAFHGEEPLSEKEVQSVARFLESQKKRLVGYLDIHSYGQMLLFPWGYTKEQTKDHIEMVRNIKTVVDPGGGGGGSGGLGLSLLLDETEARRAEKKFCELPSPLL